MKYSTITSAIENASRGDTIKISSGFYNEHIIVDKMVNIEGEPEQTYLMYNNSIPNSRLEEETMEVRTNCQIKDLIFYSDHSNYSSIQGIVIYANNSQITDCSFINTHIGIRIVGENNKLKNSNFIKNYWSLIIISNNNNIENNTLNSSKNTAISIHGNGNDVIDNYFSNDFKVYENSGIYINGNSNNIINNEIYKYYIGIRFFNNTNNIVDSNIIVSNDYGIEIRSSSSNTISANRIKFSTYYGICIDNMSSSNILYHNDILFNNGSDDQYDEKKLQVADENGNNYWDGSVVGKNIGNYWGDWNISDMDNDGIGDNPIKLENRIPTIIIQ